jgi:hypothetical protein
MKSFAIKCFDGTAGDVKGAERRPTLKFTTSDSVAMLVAIQRRI